MLRKSVLSVAVASALTLAGCGSNDSTDINAGSRNAIEGPLVDQLDSLFQDRTWPRFNLAISDVPVPNDLIFDTTAADGTFRDAAAGSTNPVLIALGSLSGASTTAAIDIPYSGGLTAASVIGTPFLTNPDGSLLLANGNAQLGIPNTPVPNPFQNVFLIELDYASGDPLTGFSASEPPTIPLAVQYQTLAAVGAQIQALAAAGDLPGAAALAPTAIAAANKINSEVDMLPYKATVLEMDGTTVLRIQPNKPLKPRARYVVVTTDEVLDATGVPTSQDPAYYNLSAGITPPSAALRPAQALIVGLWEPIAANYFALTNASRTSAALQNLIASVTTEPLPVLARSDITVSYSFMTSGDEKMLEYIANPTEWFDDSLTAFVRGKARNAVVPTKVDVNQDGKFDYFDVLTAANGAIAGFPDEATTAALSTVFAFPPPNGCQGLTGATAITCVSTVLATAPAAGLAGLLPTPGDRSASVVFGTPAPIATVSAAVASLFTSAPTAAATNVVQGTIDLPYYLGIPTGNTAAEGTVIQTSSWTADSTLANTMNAAFASVGLALPQGDTSTREATSSVVNYLFPFPAKSDGDTTVEGVQDLKVPILATYPRSYTSGSDKLPVVIFQHGITTDRSAALSVGALLAANGYATVAIDQPLHGVDAFTSAAQRSLAKTLLVSGNVLSCDTDEATIDATINAAIAGQFAAAALQKIIAAGCPSEAALLSGACGAQALATYLGAKGIDSAVVNASSVIPGLARTEHERHFNFTANPILQPIPMDFANGVGSSGSLFINLSGFTNSRDKNRQASLDLLNVLMSLKNLDLNGDGTADLDTNKVYFIGHSLGTVAGTPFVTAANSSPAIKAALGIGSTTPVVKASVMLAPASGIPRMLENSPSFAPTVVGGLAAAGVAQGSYNFEAFMRILQGALDSADPINFADNLNKGINYSAADTYSQSNRFQTSATDSGVLMMEISGTADANGGTLLKSDQVNTIETETIQLTTRYGTAFPDLLAGTNKLAKQMSTGRIPVNVLDATLDGSPDILVSRLSYGEHGMFVLPIVSSGQADICPIVTDPSYLSKVARTQAAFGNGMTQAITFLAANGEMVPGTAADAVTESEADFKARPFKQLNCSELDANGNLVTNCN
jgi:hypothetical protein